MLLTTAHSGRQKPRQKPIELEKTLPLSFRPSHFLSLNWRKTVREGPRSQRAENPVFQFGSRLFTALCNSLH